MKNVPRVSVLGATTFRPAFKLAPRMHLGTGGDSKTGLRKAFFIAETSGLWAGCTIFVNRAAG